jgi:phosphoglycerol transferase MdoB-like AlkP superfamily enzyme
MYRSELLRTLWFLSLAALFIVAVTFMSDAIDLNLANAWDRPWPIILNALPGVLLAWSIMIMSRRVLLSFWLAAMVYGALENINQIKITNLRTPLLPQDISFLRMIDANSIDLFGAYAGSLLLVAAGLAAVIAFSVLLFFLEEPLFSGSLKGRAAPTILLACVLLALGPIGNGWRHLYGSGSYFKVSVWSPLETNRQSGLFNELAASYLAYRDAGRVPPPSVPEARKLLQHYAGQIQAGLDQVTEEGQHPDIVIIQSEAFFDPSVLNQVDPGSVLSRFHEWQARGASGRLYVPAFGGGTIRTEFEVMTGISLASLPSVEYPYLQLSYPRMHGLVSVLNGHGYETRSIHANGAGFWNRESIFRAFGFKHRTWRRDFSAKLRYEGLYVSDETMTDQIIDDLEHRESDAPRFIFAISIENHGPYDVQPDIDWEAWKKISVPSGLEGQAAYDFRSYLYHLNHVDMQFDRLLNHVMASSRPTIVVLYGDHLPSLAPVFGQLGFRDGVDMQSQPVPWLMVTNYGDLRVPSGDLVAWMLPGIVLHAAGVNDDIFFTLKRMLPRDLATFTHSPWTKTDTAQADAKEADVFFRLAQVDRLRLSDDFGKVTDAIEGGDPVRVSDSVLGAYVTPEYEVGGVANDFAVDSPLFAQVKLAGKADGLSIQVFLKDRKQTVFREASVRVDVDGWTKANLDLREGAKLVPGRYQVETLLNGEVAKSYGVQIHEG